MSFIQHMVLPELPTALASHAYVDMPGYELWLHSIDNIHVLPIELDVTKFEEALSKVLQLYPHAAGQLRSNDGRWSIELTNTAVPVNIEYQLGTSSDSFLHGDWVIQDDISPFLNHQPIGANLVNGSAPLLRLKLTFCNRETFIGVSWTHALGDAICLSRFMHTLSQFYQGLSPELPAPTFKKHHFPTPPCSITAEFLPRMPHLHNPCLFSELGGLYIESSKGVEHLRWRLDSHDLSELHSALCSNGQKGTYLSRLDCLIAYVVAALNYNRNQLVQKVTSVSSYRNIRASFIDEDVAGNLVQNVPADVPVDMVGIATALRAALVRCREPDYIHNWITVASNLILDTLNAGKSFFFAPRDNVLVVNSNTVIDWCSAHFGCPDGSRFHTTGMAKFYLRPFRSNPVKGDDGVWRTRQGSVDISMGVPAELKPSLLETLACGVRHMLDNQRA